MQRKQLTLVIVSLLVVVLSVSLAYFTTQIIGKGKDVSVTSANLQIVFTDSDGALTETDIEPGWSATKTFTIKNDTKTEYKYNIVIKDLLNTFVTEGYLQYKITSTNNGYNMTEFKDIPKSSAPKDTILAYSVVIPVGETQTYTIEFRYLNDEDVDQGDDMGKVLKGTLFITEGTEEPKSLVTLIQANAVNENGYRYEGSDPNNYIQMEKTDGTTELWRIIGLFPDGENGEDVIRVRKVGYEKATYDSNSTNHWPNTTLYTTLSSTYSITNYKNTVNYKMYLGGASSIGSYTSQDLYDMERILNSKGTAGKTSQNSYQSSTIFTGSVGLMYPSDYGYGVLASDCARTIQPYYYDGTAACYTNNWLLQGSSTFQWLISPLSSGSGNAFVVLASGDVTHTGVTNSDSYSPVMALKSDVVVIGSGTNSDPYVMQ
mgnify:CR=1 FL=1